MAPSFRSTGDVGRWPDRARRGSKGLPGKFNDAGGVRRLRQDSGFQRDVRRSPRGRSRLLACPHRGSTQTFPESALPRTLKQPRNRSDRPARGTTSRCCQRCRPTDRTPADVAPTFAGRCLCVCTERPFVRVPRRFEAIGSSRHRRRTFGGVTRRFCRDAFTTMINRRAAPVWRGTVSLDVSDDQADRNRRLRLSFVGAHKCQAWHRYASSEQLR
jgi:hypothetical protein